MLTESGRAVTRRQAPRLRNWGALLEVRRDPLGHCTPMAKGNSCWAIWSSRPVSATLSATSTLSCLWQSRESKTDWGARDLGGGLGSPNPQTQVCRERSQLCEQSRRWGAPADPCTEKLPKGNHLRWPEPPGAGGSTCSCQSTPKNCLKTRSWEGEEHINDRICIFLTRRPWKNEA